MNIIVILLAVLGCSLLLFSAFVLGCVLHSPVTRCGKRLAEQRAVKDDAVDRWRIERKADEWVAVQREIERRKIAEDTENG